MVEILEKAKSCYWPALQNVYMSVTEGELGTHQEPLRKLPLPSGRGRGTTANPGGSRLPHGQLSRPPPCFLKQQISITQSCIGPVSDQ